MKIHSVFDPAFKRYGHVVEGLSDPPQSEEDTWLTARNKWLLALPDSAEAAAGAVAALVGENIDLEKV